MYIFELICKIISKKKNKNQDEEIDFSSQNQNVQKDYESCEHTFMPIDSSNEILACTKCGMLKKREDLKNKNFFMRKKI